MDQQNRKMGLLAGFAISGALSILFVTAATIGGELYKPFKGWLAGTFSHHWVGKGVIAMAIFFGLGLLFGFLMRRGRLPTGLLVMCTWVAILSTAAIVGFYIYEAFFVVH